MKLLMITTLMITTAYTTYYYGVSDGQLQLYNAAQTHNPPTPINSSLLPITLTTPTTKETSPAHRPSTIGWFDSASCQLHVDYTNKLCRFGINDGEMHDWIPPTLPYFQKAILPPHTQWVQIQCGDETDFLFLRSHV